MVAISRLCPSLLIATVLICSATPAQAQIPATKPYASLFLIGGPETGGTQPLGLSAAVAAAMDVPAAPAPPVRKQASTGSLVQTVLYGGFVTLQALDAHSTLRALDAGHAEQNPVMRWTTSHPVAFIAMKSAATAGTVYFAEKIRKKHPKGARAFIVAVNAAYAVVVLHNYKVSGR
jgi:hypothetical protein